MKVLLAALSCIAFPLPTLAADMSCEVIGITDGNSFICLADKQQQIQVRLAHIDAPERTQPFGHMALLQLADLIFHETVMLRPLGTNDYGQTVARVTFGELDISREMIRQGAAWVYPQYNHDPLLPVLEREARKARRGLWAQPEEDIVPPWEWRYQGRVLIHHMPERPLPPIAREHVSPIE